MTTITMAGVENEESGTPDSSSDPRTPVLRINQLDAFELDSALEQLVWAQFSQCFQHFRPGLLTPVEPELKALLQLLLWRFTVYSGSATVGQSLLDLRYHNALSSSPGYRPLNRRQKLGLALLSVGPRWLHERSHTLLLSLGLSTGVGGPATEEGGVLRVGMRRSLNLLSSAAQLASLVNFLVFLRRGRHPTLAERLLGARAVFSKPQGGRDVTFQYVNRELLWHGFAEFLIFLLPLVNVRTMRAAARSLLGGRGEEEEKEEAAREGSGAWRECGLCGEWPTMPHTVGCPHVFCYYCVKSHAIADPYLTCPKCGVEAGRPEPVRLQVEMTEVHVH